MDNVNVHYSLNMCYNSFLAFVGFLLVGDVFFLSSKTFFLVTCITRNESSEMRKQMSYGVYKFKINKYSSIYTDTHHLLNIFFKI